MLTFFHKLVPVKSVSAYHKGPETRLRQLSLIRVGDRLWSCTLENNRIDMWRSQSFALGGFEELSCGAVELKEQAERGLILSEMRVDAVSGEVLCTCTNTKASEVVILDSRGKMKEIIKVEKGNVVHCRSWRQAGERKGFLLSDGFSLLFTKVCAPSTLPISQEIGWKGVSSL